MARRLTDDEIEQIRRREGTVVFNAADLFETYDALRGEMDAAKKELEFFHGPMIEPFRSTEWFRGFEAAHALQECGHSRGDDRDPDYKLGAGGITKTRCVGCERESALRAEQAEAIAEAVAGAYLDAADLMKKVAVSVPHGESLSDALLSRTPADAKAAMDKLLADAKRVRMGKTNPPPEINLDDEGIDATKGGSHE